MRQREGMGIGLAEQQRTRAGRPQGSRPVGRQQGGKPRRTAKPAQPGGNAGRSNRSAFAGNREHQAPSNYKGGAAKSKFRPGSTPDTATRGGAKAYSGSGYKGGKPANATSAYQSGGKVAKSPSTYKGDRRGYTTDQAPTPGSEYRGSQSRSRFAGTAIDKSMNASRPRTGKSPYAGGKAGARAGKPPYANGKADAQIKPRRPFAAGGKQRDQQHDQQRDQNQGQRRQRPANRDQRPVQHEQGADQRNHRFAARDFGQQPANAAPLQGYIEQLRTARGEDRLRIAKQMARHGREAVSAVDRLLSSRDHYLRLAGTMVLSYVRNPQAVPALAHALQDPDSAVRLQAAAGLGEHRQPAAREALWYAFPDKTPGISIAILRSLEKMMTRDMEDALRVMDTSKLSPRVRTELEQLLARRARRKSHDDQTDQPRPKQPATTKSPLNSAPWLRMLPGDQCTGLVVPGTESIAAALLQWQHDGATVKSAANGRVLFSADKNTLPRLVNARAFEAVWVSLPRTTETELTADTALSDQLYAFSHSKGLQSLIASGDISGSTERAFGRLLGLRSARPPGNPRTLRIHVTQEHVDVELLSPTDFPNVRSTSESLPTSRTLAACLCALTVAGPHDIFFDPFCGEGAVLVERALLGPLGKAVGASSDNDTLEKARRTWHVMEALAAVKDDDASFISWKDDVLPMKNNTVDTVATILSAQQIDTIKVEHIREIGRVLRQGQKAAFLVPASGVLERFLQESGFIVLQTTAVGDPVVGTLVVASVLK